MIGNQIIEIKRVDSTNIYAGQYLEQHDPEEGTVFVAHEQFAGKGQQGNTWASEPGKNLTFTVLLKPVFLRPEQQFLLNKAITLGVLDFVHAELSKPEVTAKYRQKGEPLPVVSIKWPNDIYAGNRKIAGLLIEHRIMGEAISRSLIGIGLNVNQETFDPSLPNPVSIFNITGEKVDLKEALAGICRSLDLRFLALNQVGSARLDTAYHEHLLGYNQMRKFKSGEAVFEGKIAGVDNLGRLIIQNDQQKHHAFIHGELDFLL